LGEGAVTYLNYAFRLFYLPVGMFGVALGTVTTTRVATEAARGDRAALCDRTAEGARAVWMLASASAVGLIVLAEPVVMLLFQRRNFTAADTQALAPVVQAYMLGVVPYSLVKSLVPAFYSLDRPRVPLAASLGAVAANLGFNALTYRWLGTVGLALGTTVAALVNYAVLRLSFGAFIGSPRGPRWLRELAALAVGNAVMGALTWGLWKGGALALAHAGVATRGAVGWALLGTTIAVGFLAYALVLRGLGYPGAEDLLQLPTRVWRKLRGRR
jgi:putative peptidoglycan lipid II flippase